MFTCTAGKMYRPRIHDHSIMICGFWRCRRLRGFKLVRWVGIQRGEVVILVMLWGDRWLLWEGILGRFRRGNVIVRGFMFLICRGWSGRVVLIRKVRIRCPSWWVLLRGDLNLATHHLQHNLRRTSL